MPLTGIQAPIVPFASSLEFMTRSRRIGASDAHDDWALKSGHFVASVQAMEAPSLADESNMDVLADGQV